MVGVFLIPTKDMMMVLMLSIVRVYWVSEFIFLKCSTYKTQLLSLLPYCDSEKVGTSKKRALL